MKILLVSDEESPYLWDYYTPGRLSGYDLIISCGDLKPEYLSFLVTMANVPVLYVHGNHDGRYEKTPPEGCECIDGKLVEYNGLRILGLGGSRWYSGGKHQYTDKQMRRRILKLFFPLFRHKGVDLVVAHAPVRGFGDGDDRVHRGFSAFLRLIEKYHPRYLVHGHIHIRYSANPQRIFEYEGTTIINACERYTLEIPDTILRKT